MASRTSFSFGSQVATMDRPDGNRSALLAECLHERQRGFRSKRGFNAPFSSTTRSKRSIRGKTHEIGQLSPRDEKKLPPDRLKAMSASAVASSTRAVIVGR